MNQKMIIDLHIPVNKNIDLKKNVTITLLHLIMRKLN